MTYTVKCKMCGATAVFRELNIFTDEVEVSGWKSDPKLEHLLIEECNHSNVQRLHELLTSV